MVTGWAEVAAWAAVGAGVTVTGTGTATVTGAVCWTTTVCTTGGWVAAGAEVGARAGVAGAHAPKITAEATRIPNRVGTKRRACMIFSSRRNDTQSRARGGLSRNPHWINNHLLRHLFNHPITCDRNGRRHASGALRGGAVHGRFK